MPGPASEPSPAPFAGDACAAPEASLFLRLRDELIDALGEERPRRILARLGQALGRQAALGQSEAAGQASWMARIGPLAPAGAGVELEDLVLDRASHRFEAIARVSSSLEAGRAPGAPMRRRPGPPACWMMAGYLSGYASAALGSSVYFREVACAGTSGGLCRFEGKSSSLWSEADLAGLARVFDESAPAQGRVSAASELQRTDEELQRTAHLLMAEVNRHRRDMEELERANAILKAQQEAIPEAVLIVDLDGHVLSHNSRFLQFWKIPIDLAGGKDDAALLRHMEGCLKDPASFTRLVQHVASHPLEARHDEIIEFADGRIVSRSTMPVMVGDGEPIARAWFFHDITEQRLLEASLRHSQKMEAVGTLAGGIAHDFNNLLTAISGHLTLARRVLPAESPALPSLGIAEKAVERAAELTQSVLSLSRPRPAQRQPLDLTQPIAEVVKLLRRTIDPRIDIETQASEGLWLTRADPGQVHQILSNLCVNARDAMPSGGRLTISASNLLIRPADRLAAGGRPTGPFVVITVSDTGTGMSADVQARIFEPFFTTKGIGQGTGLGLSMVYSLVQLHGGWIECESSPGHGATFRIYLPKDQEPAVERAAESLEALSGGRETVLFADDEEIVRNLGRRVLEALGYTVLVARDGVEAVELYRRHCRTIEAVILDLLMPRRSGQETFAEIRADDPNLPIVISTGFCAPEVTESLLRSGPTASLPKPYKPQDLARTLRRMIDARAGG